ncbi:hypothetical protein J2W35_003311 [Variovorax boronicumulans]|uniref:hypothetical protein n=1 Tax=Variovorax boronicumulans TaxID=436515 RepID=UPI00278B87EF|nr:hypothetical protein [Variovorax boronicumulans]MDQ0082952.1 hypothetical protein [Variovorax boronicumulans]
MYTKFETYILRDADRAIIPFDEQNSDYQAVKEWIAAGNVLAEPVGPAHAALVEQAKAEIRIQRQPIISILDGLQSSALVNGDMARAQVIETAKQGLRDLTDLDLSACMTFEDMRLTVKTRYLQLAAALPVEVRKAFSEAVN